MEDAWLAWFLRALVSPVPGPEPPLSPDHRSCWKVFSIDLGSQMYLSTVTHTFQQPAQL